MERIPYKDNKKKNEDILLEQFLHYIRLEENSKGKDKKEEPIEKAHVAEMEFRKRLFLPNKNVFKKEVIGKTPNKDKEDCNCYIYGKPGYMIHTCHFRKKKQDKNTKEKKGDIDRSDHFVVVATEVYMVGEDVDWWLGTGLTRYLCNDKNMFKIYELVGDDVNIFMGNSSSSKVIAKGSVVLKFAFGKSILLREFMHVLDIRRNLVFGSLLSKYGFRMVLESNKLVLSKSSVFVRR